MYNIYVIKRKKVDNMAKKTNSVLNNEIKKHYLDKIRVLLEELDEDEKQENDYQKFNFRWR